MSMTPSPTRANLSLFRIAVLCGCLLIANALLQWLVDGNLGLVWPHNALRNWEEYGFGALKGQMIINPGGYEVLTKPEMYSGHRAASLYPAFLVGRLFGWTGLGALPYHVILSLAVLLSVWQFLGKSEKALAIGGMAILCPGYLLWPTVLDPNTNATLAGLPYAALLFWRLRQPHLRAGDILFLLALTLAFTSLNWTTALVHAQIFVCLLACRQVGWRRVAGYAVAGVLAAGLIVLTSLRSKVSGGAPGSGGLMQFLSDYTWGNAGYANGAGTATLLVRVAFINLLALLPLWLLWGWDWLRQVRLAPGRAFWSLLPVLVGALEVVAMRNYFCHHPWMASPLFLLGVVLSWFSLGAATPARDQAPASAPQWTRLASLAGLGGTFAFGLVVLLVYREHQAPLFSLVSLVRSHTARADAIVLARSSDAATAGMTDRLSEACDRHLVVLEQLPEPQPGGSGAFLLSSAPLEARWTLVAKTAGDPLARVPLMRSGLEWFSRNISRRRAGDRMDLAATYYLYRLPAEALAKAPALNGAVSLSGRNP